jgi:hypothetical protein
MTVVAVLLTLNMLLMHFDRIVEFYYYLYKKIFKPKFRVGEYVMISDIEFEVILIARNSKPYTYFCLPVNLINSKMYESYYHESEIKKKTGLLKELE